MARIHFPPPTSHTNPITAIDRVPSDEQLGKPRNVSGPWETQIRSLVENPPASIRRLGVTRRMLFEELDRPNLNALPGEPYCLAEWRAECVRYRRC
jgi:hypothetical protein